PHTWVEWSCSQLLQNTPLHPIAEWGRQRFGGADVPAERRLAELESSLTQVKLDPQENASLLAPLLDIPLPKERVPALASEELRRRQLAAITNWVMAGARVQPVVLALEDLHWADPTTLDVLRGIAERGALAPLCVVTTTRPEFRPSWGMRSHHATISLAPLDRQQVRDMVAEISAQHALAKDVVEDLAARTGGVPLFIEEVTRLLLERGEQGGIQAIPPTLQQSLMARLDRLGPAREVAQIASVIGRGFSYSLLRDVAGVEDTALRAALEKLAEADIVLVQGLPPDSDYRFKHALIQDAAYENLLKSRRQGLHRRVAEILRDRFATTAGAEPEALAHHFTEAGMTDAAIEWWGKAGDQALRRSAFQEAISHLGKAIELADKDSGSTPHAATAGSSGERLSLQTAYSSALLQGRGMHAPETRQAFSKARELAAGPQVTSERFSIHYGLWANHYVRGELAPMREIAELILREVEARPESPEAVVAVRLNGATERFAGNYAAARSLLERAFSIFDPQRHGDQAARFAQDIGVSITAYLGPVLWALGETDPAREAAEKTMARAIESKHVATIGYAHFHVAVFEMIRRDAAAAARHIDALVDLSRAHEMGMWMTYSKFLEPWARRGADGPAGSRLADMRDGIGACRSQSLANFTPFFTTELAEAEAKAGELETALATIDGVITEIDVHGQRALAAESHRIRAEILLKRDAANTAPAEEAFLRAIALAQQQKAKSFELRAALALAKLYQSANRAADAHAVLAPALEGFSPTPEFPEVEEAQALLAVLAESDEVKNAAASRQRRLKLQTSYGKAMMLSRGFASEESKAAFTRASELGTHMGVADERFDTYYGLYISQSLRGDVASAHETAEAFLREARREGRLTEAAAANRILGISFLSQGALEHARAHLSEALRLYDPERDRDAKFRFGADTGAAAACYLAQTKWYLGEIDRAIELIEESGRRAGESGHPPTLALIYHLGGMFEMQRGNARAALRVSEALLELAEEHQMALYRGHGSVHARWARARLAEGDAGVAELARAIAAYSGLGATLYLPFYRGLLAELEAERQSARGALSRIDDALALSQQTGTRWIDAFLHSIRGGILLKCDPADTAPAEQAFLAAISIAQQQKAKSFELPAALSLARLYQTSGRPAAAHAVLAPALEGFSPTPEFPEVAEAQTLLAALAQDDQLSAAVAKQHARAKLHVDYARAVQWGMGFAADETKAAFARAGTLAVEAPGDLEYWALMYGRFANFLMRGEFIAAHEAAASYLQQAQSAQRLDHVVNARRLLGTVKLELGAFRDSREEFEALLANWDEDRDRALRAVTGADVLCVGWAYMAQTLMCLGEVEAALRISEDAIRRAEALDDFGARAFALTNRLQIDAIRGRPDAMREPAEALGKLVSDKATPLWELNARGYAIWARGPSQTDPAAGANALGEIIGAKHERKELMRIYHWYGLIAELQSTAGAYEDALASVAKGLEIAAQTGGHCKDSYLYRVRGDVLAERDSNTAEAAYREALRVAGEQDARTFGLQAAHALGKLYRGMNRATDAHAVLAPALEGFSPTPEFPEIGAAQNLLAALAQTEDVKQHTALRQRRFRLQTAYSNALLHGRGMSPSETTAAFAKARELATSIEEPAERFSAYYGLWVGPFIRGNLAQMREVAEAFMRDAERSPTLPEAGIAHRLLGTTCWYAGDYTGAQVHLERALARYDHARDLHLASSFAYDQGAVADFYLGMTLYALGETARGARLVEDALRLALHGQHIPTVALAHHYMVVFAAVRRSLDQATAHAEALLELGTTHGLPSWRGFANFTLAWAARRRNPQALVEMRAALALQSEMNFRTEQALLGTLLAEAEAEAGELDAALATVEEQFAAIEQTGERWFAAEVHRARGEILLKRDPANPAAAERAFLTAIAIAREQKAKSFALRAALALAKLYQSSGRAADAHSVLAPALEGFSSTPEFPEIAQAQALLAVLAQRI
ncbi:MAG: hypothetical protein C5B56_00180, partial [Proteobacteria bacterium]